jgi:hypothetical protein
MKRFLSLGFVVFVYVICTGCGETFRPIIIPNPPVFPNPAAAHTAVSVNDNTAFVSGSSMVIDVSGDTDVSVANVSIHPVHAVQQSANEVLVVNQGATAKDLPQLPLPTSTCLVSYPAKPPNQIFNVCSSITKLGFNSTVISGTATVSLPIYAGSNFVAVAPSATLGFTTMPTYPPDPTNPHTVVPSIGIFSTLVENGTLVGSVPVVTNPPANANPYALAATPDNTKLYVADNSTPCSNPPAAGICSIGAFNVNTTANTLTTRGLVNSSGQTPVLSSPPIWLSARSDSQMVYVLEANGTLGYITITSTAGPDVFTETASPLIQVPGANTMIYDSNLNRLYIPGGQEVALVDVSQAVPVVLTGAPIAISTVPPSSRGTGDPCYLTTAQALTVSAAAALPDGSRAYIGAYYEDTSDNICPQVTVIDASSNTITSAIPIPGFPAYDAFCSTTRFRITMAAGGDSSRAYLASCDGGMVNIIDTTTDAYILNLPEPVGSLPPIPPSQLNPPQNPVFLIAGP